MDSRPHRHPNVQPETSPFRWAKYTARTTSPTEYVRPPGICHCWSVRLQQSSEPRPQSELHRSCFRASAKDIFVRTVLARPAHYGEGISGDALYKSTHWHWYWHWQANMVVRSPYCTVTNKSYAIRSMKSLRLGCHAEGKWGDHWPTGKKAEVEEGLPARPGTGMRPTAATTLIVAIRRRVAVNSALHRSATRLPVPRQPEAQSNEPQVCVWCVRN